MHFDQLLSQEDLRQAASLAIDITLNEPRSNRFKAFSNNEILKSWASTKASEVAKNITSGMIDPTKMGTSMEEILEAYAMEGFLIAYMLADKIIQATEKGSPIESSTPLMLELWERGLLGDEQYRFDPKQDPYLLGIKQNREDIMDLVKKRELLDKATKKPRRKE